MSRKAKWRVGVSAGIILFLVLMITVVGRDRVASDDSDLRLVRAKISDAENGHTYFCRAAEAFYPGYRQAVGKPAPPEIRKRNDEIEALLRDSKWGPERGEQLLKRHEAVFALLDQGLAKPHFQIPAASSITDTDPLLSVMRGMGKLVSIRSAYLLKTGQEKAALDEAMKLIRCGHRFEEGGGLLLHFLVGSAVKRLGLERFDSIVTKASLSANDLKPYIADLGCYYVNGRVWGDIYKAEYELNCRVVDDIWRGKTGSPAFYRMPYFFLPNDTKRLYADMYRVIIRNGTKNLTAMERVDFSVPSSVLGKAGLFLAPNSIGKSLRSVTAPAIERIERKKCAENASVSAAQVLVALKCYKLAHGKLPDRLEQLVPEYFEVVPLDDFDGNPLRYSPAKKIVYSIGEDLKDSGGSTAGKYDSKEPSYKIEF